MLNVGECIKVKTTTKDDVFGECVYRVVKTGIFCPVCKENDGIQFVMLGGTGPAARSGMTILDCQKKILADMQHALTVILNPAQAEAYAKMYVSGGKVAARVNREIEMD